MANTYIKLNGLYTAAVESEKSTLEFLEEHLRHENNIHQARKQLILDEVAAWFGKTEGSLGNHTVNIDEKTQLVVSRVAKY